MLNISIEGGKQYSLEAHVPLGRITEEGDNYGNGHIDWNPDGLFLYEIVDQIDEKTETPVIGAWRDGQFLPMNYFVCRDCSLKLETISDAYGEKLWMETADLLVGYVMQKCYPTYQSVKSVAPLQYVYAVEQKENSPEPDKEIVNNALLELITADNLSVETHLMNPQKMIRKLEGLGQYHSAYSIYGADCGEPVLIHDINNCYITEAKMTTTLPLHFLAGLMIDSVETQKFKNFTGIILHVKR